MGLDYCQKGGNEIKKVMGIIFSLLNIFGFPNAVECIMHDNS